MSATGYHEPIPYAEQAVEPCYGAVRVLMSGGSWRVSECERPEDWRDRCEPKQLPPPKPPRDWAAERHAASQIARAPHKRGAGRPRKPARVSVPGRIGRPKGTGRIHITAAELAEQSKLRPVKVIADELGCHESHLYRMLKQAGLRAADRCCEDCGFPTGRASNARRCEACSEKHDNELRNASRRANYQPRKRKYPPRNAADRKAYQAAWAREKRARQKREANRG